MDPITIEALAQIKRYEYEAKATRQRVADQLPRRTLAGAGGALHGLLLQVLSTIGVVAHSV